MSNAALAFLSGLAGGYYQGKEDQDQKARRDKADQRAQEEHDARMQELKKRADADKAVRDAATPATVSNGATVTGVSANPTVYDNADVAASDVRQANRLARLPAAAAGYQEPASLTPAPVVNGQAFPDQASASAAAAAANTPEAIRARQIAAVNGIDPERGMQMEANALTIEKARADQAKRLKDEGVFDGLRAFRAGDAEGMKAALNASGQYKIDGDIALTPEVRNIPGVGQIKTYNATFNAVGPDGKVVQRNVNSHDLSMQMMPYEKALQLEQNATKEQREAKESAAKANRDTAYAEYLRGAKSEADRAKADGTGKPLKLDEGDKLTLQSISKMRETINTEIVRAQASGMWDEKSAGAAALRKQLADLGVREQAILKKYDSAPAAGQDPVGLRKPAPAGTPATSATRVPPDVQASRDAERVAILQDELAKAQRKAAAGVPGAQGDVEAVTRELRRAGAGPRRMPAAATGTDAIAPPAAAPAVAPISAPAAPAKVDPVEASGQRLDAARAKVRALKASAPGLAKGQAAIAQYRAALAAAQKEAADAEIEYQKALGPIGPALMPMNRVMAGRRGL